MLSYQAMVFSHSGQNERAGVTTDRSLGSRKTQTFKKLPISNPAAKASSTKIILEPLRKPAWFSLPFLLLKIPAAPAPALRATFPRPALGLPASAGPASRNRHR